MAQAKDRMRERGQAQALVRTERVAEYLDHTEDLRTDERDEELLPHDMGRVPYVVSLKALGGPIMRDHLDPRSSHSR